MTEKVSLLTKFYYGFGSMAYGIKDNAFSYFLLFVYVQVFGLSPDLAGLAIFIMLIFDAFSDQGKIFPLNEIRYLFLEETTIPKHLCMCTK